MLCLSSIPSFATFAISIHSYIDLVSFRLDLFSANLGMPQASTLPILGEFKFLIYHYHFWNWYQYLYLPYPTLLYFKTRQPTECNAFSSLEWQLVVSWFRKFKISVGSQCILVIYLFIYLVDRGDNSCYVGFFYKKPSSWPSTKSFLNFLLFSIV